MKYNIEPYTEKLLDCFQNMLVTLLYHYGCNVDLLGATWPWLFKFRDNSILNKYIASDNIIEELFGYRVVRNYFDKAHVMDVIVRETKKSPIIINIDQYYVPHHFINIYNKKHGQHSLIILGVDTKKENAHCIDSLPEYIGLINISELITGILSFPDSYVKMQYSRLEKICDCTVKNEKDIFHNFQLTLDENSNFFDVFSLCKYIEENIKNKTEQEIFHWVSRFVNGNWIWEFDRTAAWTISYINSAVCKKFYKSKERQIIENLILEINKLLVSAFRLMYKYTLTKSEKTLYDGIRKMKQTFESQNLLKDHLRVLR